MTESKTEVHVVIADDDPNILAMVARTVRKLGWTVFEASNGDGALALAREKQPALVVLDVMMPGMSGWEVCRAIRDDESLAGTKVLMLTGIGERLNDMTSPLYGADKHLDKPFELKELESAMASLLEADKKSR